MELGDVMYKYETHLHTFPVSRCGRATVEESLAFYKTLGYDGVFITNHFLDGNVNIAKEKPYQEKIEFYFSDFEKGLQIGKELDIKVFSGVELSCGGTDFLVYGLDKQWYLSHPEIMEMKKREELQLMMESGALVIQAHPYREDPWIDHIRLFPRSVHGVEVINANQKDLVNQMARQYAESYGLIPFAGSDNHVGAQQTRLAGVCCGDPVCSVEDFVNRVKAEKMEIFTLTNPYLPGSLPQF